MSVVNEIENNDEVVFPSEAELSKMTKADLTAFIKKLELKGKKDERQQEWGKQFDIWLIRASRKERTITFDLSKPVTLLSDLSGSVPPRPYQITGIPKRIDKYHIQVLVKQEEIWINKAFITGCRLVQS